MKTIISTNTDISTFVSSTTSKTITNTTTLPICEIAPSCRKQIKEIYSLLKFQKNIRIIKDPGYWFFIFLSLPLTTIGDIKP